ncbi:carboxylesterase family protein [Aspergillus campestris IBT 28561]|uniref:Carboxylesterase family protein n=1 Tax=Aspergillus campestris (strain IBT 28561) TaxID=1392248 RepID=A0A2I1D526_ASPC2|nr:carboxylesterase family protein [Aspergillus campestris IBT 28561]PKY04975.1 carboxylesterase family protein [Aspergillus campestris IBT 28561]
MLARPQIIRHRCKPVTPPPHEPGVLDGRNHLFKSDCVSSAPKEVSFPGLNGTAWGQEDCLFLNVLVPEGVRPRINRVPVVHWLYGSAYAFGSKDIPVDGMALMERIKCPSDRFIHVTSNYRMGLYGWSSAEGEHMDSNVGLHDGVAALEWTQKYIERFGNDPDNIIAMGQSAGATMVALMLVANEGQEDLPFQKAFISSPALLPRRDVTSRRASLFKEVLRATKCKSVEGLRNAPAKTLVATNKHLFTEVFSSSGGATFGPGIGFGLIPDGKYILDALTVLFSQGRINPRVKTVVAGNTADEGLETTPEIKKPVEFAEFVRRTIPDASKDTVQQIRALYPQPDSEIQDVVNDWTTDVVYGCNAQGLAEAYASKTQRCVFNVPPAVHSQDLNYIFFADKKTTPVEDMSLAKEIQPRTLDFYHGRDDGEWPVYGNQSTTVNVAAKGFQKQVDPWGKNPSC